MSTQYVTTKGVLTDGSLANVDSDFEGLLERIGEETMVEMKLFTEPFDDTGSLTDSITWRTQANYHHISKNEHLIEKPDNKHAVDIGSKAPHAFFRENGTGPHMHPEGSEDFVNAMLGWGFRKGMDEDDIWKVIWAIRKRGTAKHPFAYPMIPRLDYIARKHINEWLRMWGNRAKA
jgi:hypothetical protein